LLQETGKEKSVLNKRERKPSSSQQRVGGGSLFPKIRLPIHKSRSNSHILRRKGGGAPNGITWPRQGSGKKRGAGIKGNSQEKRMRNQKTSHPLMKRRGRGGTSVMSPRERKDLLQHGVSTSRRENSPLREKGWNGVPGKNGGGGKNARKSKRSSAGVKEKNTDGNSHLDKGPIH